MLLIRFITMRDECRKSNIDNLKKRFVLIVGAVIIALMSPFNIFSETLNACDEPLKASDGIVVDPDSIIEVKTDSIAVTDTIPVGHHYGLANRAEFDTGMKSFIPNPKRAVWLSALFPGLGQFYNRRFWKLPLVVAGFMGLGYGTSWNNSMLRDYTRGYSDLMDSDPSTKSYMDFFPSTVKEEDLDREWLINTMKSRKDFYRRNRDLCIISMIGVYLLAMVDAYVDASLSQFDISPNLTMQVAPAIIPDARGKMPGMGLQWAMTF